MPSTWTLLRTSNGKRAPAELWRSAKLGFDKTRKFHRPILIQLGGVFLPISIFHIGLKLDHPLIPVEERPKIRRRLKDLQQRMTRAGYQYEIIQASPEAGLDDFRHKLRTHPCDGVLIGGGVAGNESMSYFMEQIINATHELVPNAKIMFYNHSTDVRAIVERWFGCDPQSS
jgi:hypothetical protein